MVSTAKIQAARTGAQTGDRGFYVPGGGKYRGGLTQAVGLDMEVLIAYGYFRHVLKAVIMKVISEFAPSHEFSSAEQSRWRLGLNPRRWPAMKTSD